MKDFTIIEIPDATWLTRLRKGHVVALAKKKGTFASIEWEYEDPKPGYRSGRIALSVFKNNYYQGVQSWFIGPDGTGIDGSQCLLPVMGNVPDEPREVQPKHIAYFNREMSRLRNQIEQLQDRMYYLEHGQHRIRKQPIDTTAVEINDAGQPAKVVGIVMVRSGKPENQN
jgi:hypothetical protein